MTGLRRSACVFVYSLCLAGCGGSSSSPGGGAEAADPGSQVNRFANGYRLVKETYSLPIANRTSYLEYNHDVDARTITRKSYRLDPETNVEEEIAFSDLYLDGAGRLVGGRYNYSLPFSSSEGGVTNYTLSYDTSGQLTQFRESEYTVYELSYNGELLDNISITDILDNTYRWDYTYDDQENIKTIVGGVGNKTWSYSYDEQGFPSYVVVTNMFGEQLSAFEMTYNENGNLNRLVSFGVAGNLVSESTYEYQVTSTDVFNHGLMRMTVEPIDATGLVFVR